MNVFFTERDLAARWAITIKALQRWRCVGGGPRFTKIGSRVRYPLSEIEKYEASHLVTSTSEATNG